MLVVCVCGCVCVLVTQLCPTLSDPMDCSPPGSSVCAISQSRMLEWVAISYSRGSSWRRDRTSISGVSCIGRWILYHWAIGKPAGRHSFLCVFMVQECTRVPFVLHLLLCQWLMSSLSCWKAGPVRCCVHCGWPRRSLDGGRDGGSIPWRGAWRSVKKSQNPWAVTAQDCGIDFYVP